MDNDSNGSQIRKGLEEIGSGLSWIAVAIVISAFVVSCDGIKIKHIDVPTPPHAGESENEG